MASERVYEEARQRAELVLAALERHRLAASPENYRIWYVHLAGEDPALSRALRVLLESGEPIDELRCAELYERFLVRAAEERTLLRAGKRLSDLAGELTLEVSAFCGETTRYGTSLQDARADADAGPTAERLNAITRGMIGETDRMQAHVDQAETHLRASMAEIEGLRRDLQAAWSEARTDGLTGLANRRHFDQALRAAAAQAIEHGSPACVVIADIDCFKQFNDTHGHAFGDQVLKLVAGLLRHNVKGQDLVARYGGEEFAVILPATRLSDAFTLVDRLRDLVSCRQIRLKDRAQSLGRVTLSIGVTEFRPGEPCAEWMARADAALYRAKREGRNRVIALTAGHGPPADRHALPAPAAVEA
jgi:diguanylate cyclase